MFSLSPRICSSLPVSVTDDSVPLFFCRAGAAVDRLGEINMLPIAGILAQSYSIVSALGHRFERVGGPGSVLAVGVIVDAKLLNRGPYVGMQVIIACRIPAVSPMTEVEERAM